MAEARSLESPRYTLAFAALVCVVCAALVSVAAVALRPAQKANALLYMEKNVLLAAGLIEPGQAVSSADVEQVFQRSIEVRLVDLASGELLPAADRDARRYDQRAARNDPLSSREAPPNHAGVRRIPKLGIVYLIRDQGRLDQVVVAIEGLGMWGTIYGFLSLASDGNTIRGLTCYDQRETPGLGGEIANPTWQALWRGRKAYDANWDVAIQVIKGAAGPAQDDPARVDGLSGSTVTSKAMSQLVRFWLGAQGYGAFLKHLREGSLP